MQNPRLHTVYRQRKLPLPAPVRNPDASVGLIRNENDSMWFRVNAKSVSESFGIQSVWMRDGIIRTECVVARNHSDWTGNGAVSFRMTLRY